MAKKENSSTSKTSKANKPAAKKSVKKVAKKTPKKMALKKTVKKTVKKAPAEVKAVKKAATKSAQAVSKPKSGSFKTPLSKAELKEFRQMLLDKRRSLVGDLNGMEAEALRRANENGGGDLSSLPTHLADLGSDNYEQEFTLGLLESERIMLNEIDEALERIDLGTFGICLGTGEPINKPRLRARPWAKYCIEYARKLEKGVVRINEEHESIIAGRADGEVEFDEDF